VVAVLAAAGCSPGGAPTDGPDPPGASSLSTPGDDSAEAGFARDMATHHAQAVDMAFLLRDGTTDQRLRSLADDIIVTQSAQRGMFMGWLQLWELPQAAAGPRMTWMATGDEAADTHASMDHAHGPGDRGGLTTMAGMASEAELDALRRATDRDAEVLFLQLMIRHHEGGVLMARALLDRSTHDAVVTLARGIEAGQAGEIETMTAMLTERGAEPLPSLLP
jgi:uncharacterized protein (DUF305 family)